MAAGDITVFEESRALMIDGGWANTSTVYIALITSATNPAASDATPALGDYTEISTAGTYGAAGGQALDTIANMVTEAAGVVTFADTGTSVTWAQNSSNASNARWGIIHIPAGDAIAFLDLGTTIDMTAGDLTINWNSSGIFTITS